MNPSEAAGLASCLAHPVRVEFLTDLRQSGRLSPVDFSRRSGHLLGNVSYHVRVLHGHGLIEVCGTEQRRGAVVHYYSPRRSPDWQAVTGLLDLLGPFESPRAARG
jgi:hypothetical protein